MEDGHNRRKRLWILQCGDMGIMGNATIGFEKRATLFSGLLDSIPDLIFFKDRSGYYIGCNAAFEAYIGLTCIELVGKTDRDLVAPDLAARFQEHDNLVLSEGIPQHFELAIDYANGRQAFVETSLSPLKSEAGEVIGLIGVCRDITDRKSTEQSLRANEEKLDLAIKSAQMGIFHLDFHDNRRYYDKQICLMLGISPADFAGTENELLRLLHPEDRSIITTAFQRTVEDNVPYEPDFRIIRPDGSLRFLSVRGRLLRDSEGKPLRLIGVAWETTQQRKAEQALQEREELYRALAESSQDFIFLIDHGMMIKYVNKSAADAFGSTLESMIGREMAAFFPPGLLEKQTVAINRVFLEGLDRSSESQIVLPGKSIWIHTWLLPIRDKTGRIYAVQGVSRNITERKHAEQELIETNRLLKEQTARANEMAVSAESANAAKREFLANMSHEIRTPMNGIIGMTDLLLDTVLNEEQLRYARVVKSSGETLLNLLNDILDISKIEAGKLEIEQLNFDLRVMMDDFLQTMEFLAEKKGLELISFIDPAVPSLLKGDPGRLRQILTNLTGNAVKFTEKGEVEVDCRLDEDAADSCMMRFSVRDTGIGIPDNRKNLLFNHFSQVDGSTTRKFGGTGLGLVISKQLAELMGGEVGFRSEEGMGSTFWFTVRLAKPPAETLVNAAAIPCLADLRGVRALIVDDNPINRQILSKRLATWDMRVFACNDGPDAFLALGEAVDEGDPFNIAIIDMQMPGMSGEVLGRMIKADRRFAGVKLVMMTSTGMRGDARRSREIGFSAYLLKPVNLNLLADALGMVLSEKDADGGTGSTVTRHLIRESERSRIRILLAEDNATNQQVALSMFKKLGFPAVDLVETGNEVLAALAQKTYSMVFMDVQMPEMDGLQATKCIRDVSSASVQHDIPIIAMTAHAMQGDREKCLAAGMNDYITKPIALKALAEAVNRWRKPGYREDGNRSADNTGDGKEVSAIFNYASLLERMMGDSKLAREILRTFLEDLPVHIEKLKTTIVSRDKPGIASQAHSLRGAVANIGGDLLSSVAAELERAGTGGDLALVKSSFAELEKQSELLCEEIQGTLGIETNRRRD